MTKTPHAPIRLYGLASHDRGAKVRWLLTELGVPYTDRWLDREKKEHELPAFLRLNPLGRVPVLEMGDTVIFESGAICAYLADYFLEGGMAPALADPNRADYQRWMYLASSTLDTIQTRIMVIEDIPPGDVYEKKFAALAEDFRDLLAALDVTLAKQSHLVGNRFSAADIGVSYHLSRCLLWPELEVFMASAPRVGAYLERMKKLPSAVQAQVFSRPE